MKRKPVLGIAIGLLAVVALGLLAAGFGSGWLAISATTRPVGHLRPADLIPAVSETTPAPTTLTSTTAPTTAPTTLPPSTTLSAKPTEPTKLTNPTQEPGDGDGDRDD